MARETSELPISREDAATAVRVLIRIAYGYVVKRSADFDAGQEDRAFFETVAKQTLRHEEQIALLRERGSKVTNRDLPLVQALWAVEALLARAKGGMAIDDFVSALSSVATRYELQFAETDVRELLPPMGAKSVELFLDEIRTKKEGAAKLVECMSTSDGHQRSNSHLLRVESALQIHRERLEFEMMNMLDWIVRESPSLDALLLGYLLADVLPEIPVGPHSALGKLKEQFLNKITTDE